MAITRIPFEDVIASVEEYVYNTAWPDAAVKQIPTAHEAFTSYSGAEGECWAAMQFIGPVEREANRDGVYDFDVRLLVFSREPGRLAATRRADQIGAILQNVTLTIQDRSDGGTTNVAKATMQTALASAPSLDDRGIRLSVLEVSGSVYPD